MSRRITAFLVLVGIISIPLGLYWYFVASITTEITIMAGSGMNFSLTFYGSLPIKSTILGNASVTETSYECIESCTITMIPMEYTYTATASGFIAMEGSFSLARGEKRTLTLTWKKAFTTQKIEQNTTIEDREIARFETWKKAEKNNAELLTISEGMPIVEIQRENGLEIGTLLQNNTYEMRFLIPGITKLGETDQEKMFVIVHRENMTEIYRLSDAEKYTLPSEETILTVHENMITTEKGCYEETSPNIWEMNPLYDDIREVGGKKYTLVKSDEKKKILEIEDEMNDAIFTINPDTHEREKILENTNAKYLIEYNGNIGYVTKSGEKYEVLGEEK